MSEGNLVTLTKKDFESDQEVRWCAGCGDYAILAAVQKALASTGLPRENHVFVSGIGCSSRFPYYMNTYGFHTIHGRAPAIATGLKVSRPELTVWVITGDGDALSIGGNHFIHLLRRNVNVKVLLFNNKIYGLTKGQYSPTSDKGTVTKSTPLGSLDEPIDPISLALAAKASFVARTSAVDVKHLTSILLEAVEHKGSSVIEILQNCPVFNDGVFDEFTGRKAKSTAQVELRPNEPLTFGEENEKGIGLSGLTPHIVEHGGNGLLEQVLIHDPSNRALAQVLSNLEYPQFPVPMGVFLKEDRAVYEESLHAQIGEAKDKKKAAHLGALLRGNDSWTLE